MLSSQPGVKRDVNGKEIRILMNATRFHFFRSFCLSSTFFVLQVPLYHHSLVFIAPINKQYIK